MFRRLIYTNVKTIGIRRLSNCNNNCMVAEELKKVNVTLSYICFTGFSINIALFVIANKR